MNVRRKQAEGRNKLNIRTNVIIYVIFILHMLYICYMYVINITYILYMLYLYIYNRICYYVAKYGVCFSNRKDVNPGSEYIVWCMERKNLENKPLIRLPQRTNSLLSVQQCLPSIFLQTFRVKIMVLYSYFPETLKISLQGL